MKGIKILDRVTKIILFLFLVAFFVGAFKFLILDNELLFPEESVNVNNNSTNNGTNNSGSGNTSSGSDDSGSSDTGNDDTTPGEGSGGTDEGGTDEGGTTTPVEQFQFVEVDGGYEVQQYLGSDTVVSIPATYNGKPVIGLGKEAFINNKDITEVVIPEGVLYISYSCFAHCSSLYQVYLPESLTRIDYNVFTHCVSIPVIYIPVSVITFGENIFFGCTSLSQIRVGWSSTDGRAYIDWGCSVTLNYFGKEDTNIILLRYAAVSGGYKVLGYYGQSDYVAIPSTYKGLPVVEIGDNAFLRCSIKKIFIPSSVSRFGASIFSGCNNLVEIRVGWAVSENEEHGYFHLIDKGISDFDIVYDCTSSWT